MPRPVRLFALLVGGAVCAAACGQDTQPAPTSMPTFRYSDPGFGFELELPAGWDYDRSRFQQFQDSIGLLRGYSGDGHSGLQILVFRSFPMPAFEDWIVSFGKALAELTNAQRVDWETWQLPPRAGAILTYSSKLGSTTTRTHYLCVPFDANTVWVLIYSGSAGQPAEEQRLRAAFNQVIRTLRIHYDPTEVEKLAPAYERGQALLARLAERAHDVRIDDGTYYYAMILDGRPIGYLSRRVSREEHDFSRPEARQREVKPGIRLRERWWRFADDGTAWHGRVDLFSSFDRQSELIEDQQTQIPPPDAAAAQLFTRTTSAIREARVLVPSFTTSRDTALPEPSKPIEVGPVYLDGAWSRLLPGLLLGDTGREPYAFATYNPEARALLALVIRSLGPQQIDGWKDTVHGFEVREGFVDAAGRLLCDQRGVLVRAESGDLVLQRMSQQALESQFGERRAAAERRLSGD